MILRLPFPRPAATTPPDSHRVTSQCLEIAGWTHGDCVEGWCRCSCHQRQAADLAARLRTYREQQQARLDAGPLGRRGTTNRALDAWTGGVGTGIGGGSDPAETEATPWDNRSGDRPEDPPAPTPSAVLTHATNSPGG